MAEYRKKLDTRIFTPEQFTMMNGFPDRVFRGLCNSITCHRSNNKPHVHTIHEGQIVNLEHGDWIMPEPDGVHYYPIKPNIFAATYELVDAPPDVQGRAAEIVPQSALYWLKNAKDESCSMAERLFYMENAYNHVVNALAAALSTQGAAPAPVGSDEPCAECDLPLNRSPSRYCYICYQVLREELAVPPATTAKGVWDQAIAIVERRKQKPTGINEPFYQQAIYDILAALTVARTASASQADEEEG